jgi:hypothetical protein
MLFPRKRREVAPSKPLMIAVGLLAAETLVVAGYAGLNALNSWLERR